MKSFVRSVPLVALSALLSCGGLAGCGGSDGESGPVDVGEIDTGKVPEIGPIDTGAIDTAPADDTAPPDDTTPPDTGTDDTTVVDTGSDDTGTADTSPADTATADTTVADTAVADTTVADTTVADTTVADTTVADSAGDSTLSDSAGDAKVDGDAATDAPSDSATDGAGDGGDSGPTVGAGSIWFYGDYATDTIDTVGRHDLPGAVTTTIKLPKPAAHQPQVNAMDVSRDGKKIAIAFDPKIPGRNDLYVFNRDGTGSTVIVEMAGTFDVEAVKFSPDGTKLAYLAEIDADNARDVFVVPVAGGTPVRVSPRRTVSATPQNLSVSEFAWSRDSKYVAIGGDLITNRVQNLWVTDTSVAVPAPKLILDRPDIGATLPGGAEDFGVRGTPEWTLDNRILFKGKMVSDLRFGLYAAKIDGLGFGRLAGSPTLNQVGSIGVSADGTRVAYSADVLSANAYDVYALDLKAGATPLRLTTGTIAANRNPDFFSSLKWSPDGASIAFFADYGTLDNKYEPYSVSSTVAGHRRLVAIGSVTDANQDCDAVAWSPDSKFITFIADHRKLNDTEVFRTADATTPNQVAVLVQGVVTGGDLNPWVMFTP